MIAKRSHKDSVRKTHNKHYCHREKTASCHILSFGSPFHHPTSEMVAHRSANMGALTMKIKYKKLVKMADPFQTAVIWLTMNIASYYKSEITHALRDAVKIQKCSFEDAMAVSHPVTQLITSVRMSPTLPNSTLSKLGLFEHILFPETPLPKGVKIITPTSIEPFPNVSDAMKILFADLMNNDLFTLFLPNVHAPVTPPQTDQQQMTDDVRIMIGHISTLGVKRNIAREAAVCAQGYFIVGEENKRHMMDDIAAVLHKATQNDENSRESIKLILTNIARALNVDLAPQNLHNMTLDDIVRDLKSFHQENIKKIIKAIL